MSFLPTQFHVLSDLHLETPLSAAQYTTYNLGTKASNILLLGDVGLVKHEDLFIFLRRVLDRNRGSRIFFVLGNHEAYQTTLAQATHTLREFEQECSRDFGSRFKFLSRDRYDVNDTITILGCTLWTNVLPEQASQVHSRLADFHPERGIRDWTLEILADEHAKDLAWLNAAVCDIQANEPHRQVLVATHHCPTTDSRAMSPKHAGSTVSSGFVNKLEAEVCWTSRAVKMWAFGHTHYSCCFVDDETGKLVVSNQKGYVVVGGTGKNSSKNTGESIVEVREGKWQIVNKG